MSSVRVLALAAVLVFALAGCDWSMYGYGPQHTFFNPLENTINAGNVSKLTPRFVTPADSYYNGAQSVAVAAGVLYVVSYGNKVSAFDAAGATNCSGTPTSCAPLWTAAIGGVGTSPSVSGGVLFVGAVDKVYAFDARGTTNCAGSPKVCSPLWTANAGATVTSPATVAGGEVYVGTIDGTVSAFDAAGTTNCSGSPKACAPLWTASTGTRVVFAAPTVANGVLYVGAPNGALDAYDATGTTNCSGAPKTCAPLWTATVGDQTGFMGVWSTAVANGFVYVGGFDGSLYVFDAAGSTNCSGHPKTCTELWYALPQGEIGSSGSAPAIANGLVFMGGTGGRVSGFDMLGVTNCSGTPKHCLPLWSAGAGSDASYTPVVANGVVFVGGDQPEFYAFDASGTAKCTGSPARSCQPLWTGDAGTGAESPIVANGIVYVGGNDHVVHAFSLPS